MKIEIKTIHHLKVSEEIAEYARKKLQKFKRRLPQNSKIEVVFEDLFGPRGGQDKLVHLHLYTEPLSDIVHLQAESEDFRKSIDLIQEKLEKTLERDKDRH